MGRKRLFAWTDLFAVLGLLLLAAWVPAYAAESAAAEGPTEAGVFHLPPARIGDRVVYGLVAQWEDQAPVAVSPLVEVSFRSPRPDESPFSSWIVEEWTWVPQHVDLGFAEYLSPPSVLRNFYDGEGHNVWSERDWVDRFPREDGRMEYGVNWQRDGEEHWRTSGLRPADPTPSRTVESGTEVRRAQDWDEFTANRSYPAYLQYVGDGPLGPLYGANARSPMDRIGDDLKQLLGRERPFYMDRSEGHSLKVPLSWPISVNLMLKDEFSTDRLPESWAWYHPDLPVLAGAHVEVHDPAGALIYSLDVVPLTVEKGSGRGLTPPPSDPRGWSATDSVRDPSVERMQLGRVKEDARPLLRDVSLADVWGVLQDGPSTIRDLLPEGRLVGFSWLETGTETRTGEAPILPPELVEGESHSVYHSDWVVAVAGRDGNVRVAHVAMTDRFGAGIVSATVQDACGGVERPATAWPTQIACGHVDAPLIADDREVITAHDVIDRVRAWDGSLDAEHTCHRGGAASGSAPCEFAWLPVFVCDIEEMGCEGSPLLVEMEHTFRTGIPHEHALPFEGYARWETMTPTSGRLDLGTGLPRDRRSEDVRPVEETIRQTTPLQAEPVVYAPVAPAALAMGGVLLILVSVLARMGHWVFGGGAGPALAAFYARVTKQDALSHARRDEIMQTLREDPGLTLSDLAKRLGAARTPTLHHLETLRRTGHATHVQNGRRRHWFVVESTDPAARVALAMEQDPVAARFLAIVRESPGITVSEIADRMDRSKHAASRTGSRLEALGLVAKRKEGRTVRFEVASSPSASLQRESVESDGVVA